MEFLNLLFSLITGWSIGYVGVYYRTKEYQKYFPILFYVHLIVVAIDFEVNIMPIIAGMAMCIVTIIFTYDPILPNGHKIFKEKPLYKRGNHKK